MNVVLQSVMSMPTARTMTDLMFVLVRRDTLEMENLAQVSSKVVVVCCIVSEHY